MIGWATLQIEWSLVSIRCNSLNQRIWRNVMTTSSYWQLSMHGYAMVLRKLVPLMPENPYGDYMRVSSLRSHFEESVISDGCTFSVSGAWLCVVWAAFTFIGTWKSILANVYKSGSSKRRFVDIQLMHILINMYFNLNYELYALIHYELRLVFNEAPNLRASLDKPIDHQSILKKTRCKH